MRTLLVLFLAGSTAWGQTVAGTVQYEDRVYTNTGFTGALPPLPVRHAEVEIIRTSDSAVLGTGFTDSAGTYTIAAIGVGETVFPRIYARTDLSGTRPVEVRNTPGGALYTAAGASTLVGAGTTTIDVTITFASGGSAAFNILDMGVLSFDYLATIHPGGAPTPPAPINLFWFSGGSPGTFFDRAENEIYLLGKTVDSDEFDDDIILHEIGHYIAFHFSKDDSPGGPHSITGLYDVRLAWSEGWAHYWSGTVRRFAGYASPATVDPWEIVDTAQGGVSLFEFETPSFPADTVTAENELAVVAILWDVTDPANDDPIAGDAADEADLWQSLVDFKASPPDHVSLEDFRARWESNNPADYADTFDDLSPSASIAQERTIRYFPDANEPNDTTATASGPFTPTTEIVLASQTLFKTTVGVGDEDWYRVSLLTGAFRAETANLKSGCDTVLEFYDTDGTTQLASNDDRALNDFSSIVNLEINAIGDYFVRVLAFVGSNANTENGTYDLRLLNPANLFPAITVTTPPPSTVEAPTPVTIDVSATDPDGYVIFYEWDFDGDDVYESSSIEGGKITHVFDQEGTFSVQLRVTDNGGGQSFKTFTVVVTAPVSSASLAVEFANVIAPATATFTLAATGFVPVTFEWDFDGNGSIDAASTTNNQAVYVYREATSVIAKGYVTDASGRRFAAQTDPLFILVGATPPSITSFTATPNSVTLPQTVILSVSASGTISRVEWDVDGDGGFDRDTGTTTTLFHQYQRVGDLLPRVRVTDANGLTATSVAQVRVNGPAVAGWIVDPHDANDKPKIFGSSVTLTAEAVPRETSKKVQFQFRTDNPVGTWIDIGPPIVSTGTLFSVAWNVTGFGPTTVLDLRILIDDSVSSGDDDNTVIVNDPAPGISESGTTKDVLLSDSRSLFTRTGAGTQLHVPYGSGSGTIRIEPGASPAANGSAVGLSITGQPVKVVFTTLTRPALLRLPIPPCKDPTRISVHRFDESTGTWRREFPSQVLHADGLVEIRILETGIFAMFQPASGGGGGGGCFGSLAGTAGALPWIVAALGAAILLFLAGRWIFLRTAILTLEDTVVASGSSAALTGWLERDLGFFWDPDLPGEEIEFFSEEGTIGFARTGSDGRARLEIRNLSPGIHRFRAQLSQKSRYHAPRVEAYIAVYETGEPVLVTDIDMTLAHCSPLGFITKSNLAVRPLIDSPISLQNLSRDYRIVYLSARDHVFVPKTRAWLRMNGFPNGPLLLRRKRFNRASPLEHKRERLREVKREVGGMRYGIGDKPHDVVAYHEQGIRPIWITNKTNGALPGETIRVSSWKEIVKEIGKGTS